MNSYRTPRDTLERRIKTLEDRERFHAGRIHALTEVWNQPWLNDAPRTLKALSEMLESAKAARDLGDAELRALRRELDEEEAA